MTLQTSAHGAWAALAACREQSPLVQCITNFVSMVSHGTLHPILILELRSATAMAEGKTSKAAAAASCHLLSRESRLPFPSP